jgi:hypothetical protein
MGFLNICLFGLGSYLSIGTWIAYRNLQNVRKREDISEKIQNLRKEMFTNGCPPLDIGDDLPTVGFDGNWAKEELFKDLSFFEIVRVPDETIWLVINIVLALGWPKFRKKIYFDQIVLELNSKKYAFSVHLWKFRKKHINN